MFGIPTPEFWQLAPMVLESVILVGAIGWAWINEREKADLRARIEALEEDSQGRDTRGVPSDD